MWPNTIQRFSDHYTDATGTANVGRTLQDALSARTSSTVEGKVLQVIFFSQQSSYLTFGKYGLKTIENHLALVFIYISHVAIDSNTSS